MDGPQRGHISDLSKPRNRLQIVTVSDDVRTGSATLQATGAGLQTSRALQREHPARAGEDMPYLAGPSKKQPLCPYPIGLPQSGRFPR